MNAGRTSEERRRLGEPELGTRTCDDRLAVAEAAAAADRVVDQHERVADLVQALEHVGRSAVGDALALHVQRPAPVTVMMIVPAEVEAGAEMEAGVGGHGECERPLAAIRHTSVHHSPA